MVRAQLRKYGQVCASVGITLLFLIYPTALHAQQGTASIAQGYQTSEQGLVPGTLLSLTPNNQAMVIKANTDNVDRLIGINGNQPLLELSSGGNQVQVVTSGSTIVLVSDLNGSIKAGDHITASPISGVGMKATTSVEAVGVSQADFSLANSHTQTITDTSGQSHTIHVGLLPVQVSVTFYSLPATKTSILPSFLQNFADSIAGHDVSAIRLFMSGVVLLLGLVSIAVLASASIRSSIISIGRNPLSEGAVQKSLLEVGATALGILLVVLIAIYLILRL